MSCEAIQLDDCEGCRELAAKIVADRKRYGARGAGLYCDACGATVYPSRERTQPGPRAPTAAELEQRAVRDLDQWLRDASAIARWRRHAARDCVGVLAAMQGTTVTAGTSAEADTLRASPVDGDRERDLRRGRALDAVLRGLEATCADKRSVAVLLWCVERGGAERTRYKSVAELIGAAFTDPKVLARRVAKGDAALANAAHGGPLLAAAVACWTKAKGETR